jgi:hypothetical protein
MLTICNTSLNLAQNAPHPPAVAVAILAPYLWTFQPPDADYPLRNARRGSTKTATYTVVALTTWHRIALINPRHQAAPYEVL